MKVKKRFKGLVAMALSVAMCITALPVTAEAFISKYERDEITFDENGLSVGDRNQYKEYIRIAVLQLHLKRKQVSYL